MKREYQEFNENDTTEYLDCLSFLKKVNDGIHRQEVIQWFNENNIDYFNMSDLDMYIYYIEKNTMKFNNGDLNFDLQKILSFDTPITVSKNYDSNLDYPFALDVEDTSYWYSEQKERDEDFEKLKLVIPIFTFI
jgi:hypothetical protein